MRLGLQITMAILSLIPFGFGLINLFYGASQYMPADQVTAPIDSQFRYLSAIYVAVAVLIWWIIPQVERMTVPFRILVLGLFMGGVGRVISLSQYGEPLPQMVGGMYLELALPLLIVWQWLVARKHG